MNPKTGRPVVVKRRARTKEDANRILKELQIADHLGQLKPTGGQTLDQYMSTWIETVVKGKNAPTTYDSYGRTHRLFISTSSLGKKKMTDITSRDIQLLLNAIAGTRIPKLSGGPREEETYSKRQVGIVRTVLNICFNYALRIDRIINVNPVQGASLPRSARQPDRKAALTTEDFEKLIAEVDPEDPYGRVILFMLGTATRVGEAIGLTWEYIDLQRGLVTIRQQLQRVPQRGMVIVTQTKTGQQRTVGVPKSILELLQELKRRVDAGEADSDSEGIVFLNHNGGRMESQGVTRRLKTLCGRAGIGNKASHILRHTAATLLLEATGDIHAVSKQLGHKSIKLTADTYGHLLEGRRSEMADVLDKSITSARTEKKSSENV